jgi:hypothetical protein
MLSERIIVRFCNDGLSTQAATVCLNELTGQDEMSVAGINTACSIDLLDKIVAEHSGSAGLSARKLCASDRDSLLAALHRQYWGDTIVSSLTCSACGKQFDLSFTLSDLQSHINSDIKNWIPGEQLTAVSSSGAVVEIPDAEQELQSANGGTGDAIAELAGALGIDPEAIAEACDNLEQAAPILDLELDASCAECGADQQAHFDIQSFVMKRILNERESLLTEIHFLAANYNWSLTEILGMPRSMRKTLAQMLDA